MQIERHVFGSYKGYMTLARSAGVSMDDCRLIERCAHSFGQTYESRYYRSLARRPAWFTQQFAGNRRGLTRVTEGPADDQGRSTLCFITAIVSRPDWDMVLMGDIGALADCRSVWDWDGSGTIAALNVDIAGSSRIPTEARSKALDVISQLERTVASCRPVVGSESEIGFDVVRAVEMLLPTSVRNAVTTSCRVLSPQFPSLLNVLADEVADAATFRLDEHQPLSPYAQAIEAAVLSSGNVPVSVINEYSTFGSRASRQGGQAAMPRTRVVTEVEVEYRMRKWPVIAAGAGGVIAGLLAGYLACDLVLARRMRASGLDWFENRWLTQEESQRAVRVARGEVEIGGRWVKKEDKEKVQKAAEEREQFIDRGMVRYKDRWLTIDQAYEAGQLDSGHELFAGMWVTKDVKQNAQGKLWDGKGWVTAEEAFRMQQQDKGLKQGKLWNGVRWVTAEDAFRTQHASGLAEGRLWNGREWVTAEEAFRTQQEANGLKEYGGRWYPKEVAEEMQAKDVAQIEQKMKSRQTANGVRHGPATAGTEIFIGNGNAGSGVFPSGSSSTGQTPEGGK